MNDQVDDSVYSEADRLAALDRYRILDTAREAAFDDIAELAAGIFEAPIAVVNLVADERQWFKAEIGIGKRELPLDVSICRHAILQRGVFVVPDLSTDVRFENNPLVKATGGLRFYAGAVLETPEGLPLGTVCVLDVEARPEGVTGRQARALKALASQTMAQLEARRLQAQTRQGEARLRAVFDQAAAGFARTDLSGQFKEVNDRYCAIVGRSREELLALRMQDITHPDDLVSNAPLFETTAAGGSSFEIEKRYVRPDGSTVWVRNSVSLVREDGVDEAVLAVTIDISDRRRAEEALRKLNDNLESEVAERTEERDRMWDTSPDLMLVIDFEGYFRRVNPAWTSLLGYPPDELIGHHVNEFVLPEDHNPTVEAYELAADGGQPRISNRYRHKDGSTRWISWTAAPAGDKTYATGRDITAEKRREAELLAAQEALRQSQKLEAMGQLTGGVAHDFNNLLTPIVGSLDMLQRQRLGGEREQRLIAGAAQSADRAKTLVQRLLAFARRQALQPTAVDVGALVQGMTELLASTTGPQIKLEVEITPNLPRAQADPNQLEMALLNLGVNARDAMPNGGSLCISVDNNEVGPGHRAGLEPGHYVRLSVTDTGTGMDDATLKRAVEPFFSTKGVGKGTGLGLSMVHGLASQLGGAVAIQSEAGVGTTVELFLPASTQPAQDVEPAINNATIVPGRTGGALLVDDEELVRLSTADMLADLGYEVTEATSAEEALRIIDSGRRFDLVVTDHLMPGMTGAELVHEVLARTPNMPALVVTGYSDVESLAPHVPRLTKPFRRDDLAQALSSICPWADGRRR